MKKSLFSAFFVLIFCSFSFGQNAPTKSQTDSGKRMGQGSGVGSESSDNIISNSNKALPLRILSKPPARYTDVARKNGVEGIVRLKVVFLASGEIGDVTIVSTLADGLTEQAVEAAKNLKFEPAKNNGFPINVIKIVDYNFSIYYNENDKDLSQKASILEMPDAEHPTENELQNIRGKVKIVVALGSNGIAQIVEINTDLPKEFARKAAEAVAKIKFTPAIHKSGNAVTQTKEIEYEFNK